MFFGSSFIWYSAKFLDLEVSKVWQNHLPLSRFQTTMTKNNCHTPEINCSWMVAMWARTRVHRTLTFLNSLMFTCEHVLWSGKLGFDDDRWLNRMSIYICIVYHCFFTPQSSLVPLCSQHFLCPSIGKHWSDFHQYTLILLLLEFCIHGVIHYVHFVSSIGASIAQYKLWESSVLSISIVYWV